jgi:putative peptidoglycan lipid II flippase
MLNFALVPLFQHAALTLSVGLGALINALWLLVGLLRRGSYKPMPGWGIFLMQVFAASALLAVFLMWATGAFPWTRMAGEHGNRVLLMALILTGSAVVYFGATWAAGLKLRQFIRR